MVNVVKYNCLPDTPSQASVAQNLLSGFEYLSSTIPTLSQMIARVTPEASDFLVVIDILYSVLTLSHLVMMFLVVTMI